MHDPEADPVADGSAQKPTPRDPALLMRRAIRAVAAAELILAESLASAARRGSDLNARQATSAHRARERSTADRPDADRPHADRPDADEVDERHAECEAALHVAVDKYVCLLRAAGKAPERALIHLKDVLRSTPAVDLEGADRVQMMERVVRWGIEAYYRPARAGDAPTTSPTANALARAYLATLDEYGLHALLARLNARTRYRYTGLYRIEGPLLRNLALFDRESPELQLGDDIDALVDTCCDIVAETGRPFATVDTHSDPRIGGHRARFSSIRSYQGAPICASDGRVWGTLCHFDLRPRLMLEDEVDVLWLLASSLPIEALVA